MGSSRLIVQVGGINMLYPITSTSNVYKFNVDILVKGESNAATLEKLLHLLHASPDVLDLRIQSGVEMGSLLNLMEAMQQNNMDATPFGKPTATRGRNQSPALPDNAGEKKAGTAAVHRIVPESHPTPVPDSHKTKTESSEKNFTSRQAPNIRRRTDKLLPPHE